MLINLFICSKLIWNKINEGENTGLKHLNYSKACIEYSNYMGDVYNNTKEHSPNK